MYRDVVRVRLAAGILKGKVIYNHELQFVRGNYFCHFLDSIDGAGFRIFARDVEFEEISDLN